MCIVFWWKFGILFLVEIRNSLGKKSVEFRQIFWKIDQIQQKQLKTGEMKGNNQKNL